MASRAHQRKLPAAEKYEGGPQKKAGPLQYAKAFVAIAGASVTAALGIIPADTTTWSVLTVAAAGLTASGVYFVPNKGG
jgi:hypothetical protein